MRAELPNRVAASAKIPNKGNADKKGKSSCDVASESSDEETKTPRKRVRTELTISGSSSESQMEIANEVDIERDEWSTVAKKKGKKVRFRNLVSFRRSRHDVLRRT